MKTTTTLFIFFLMLFMLSCNSNDISIITENHFINNNYDPVIIAENKVKIRESIEILDIKDENIKKLESKYDSDIKKVIEQHFFDENGYCYLKVIPRYLSYKLDTTGISKISDPIEKFAAYVSKESPVHSGLNDSIFYFFDDKKRLIEEIESTPKSAKRQWRTSIKYKYDNNNNLLERCVDSKDFPINCNYFKYKFNSSDNTVVVIDSCFASYENKPRVEKTVSFYNKNKKVNYDGRYFYEYDKKSRIRKKYDKFEVNKSQSCDYTYNANGNLVIVTDKSQKNNHFTIRNHYNENKLLIQQIRSSENDYKFSIKNGKSSNTKIIKYEYK
jgi:hypothetical protein